MEHAFRKWNVWIAAALCIALFTVGCARTQQAGVPVSADYKLAVAVATVLEADKIATDVVINLNTNKLLDASTTGEILSYCYAVAQNGKTAIAITQSTATVDQKRAEVAKAFASVTDTAVLTKYLQAHANDPQATAVVAAVTALQTSVQLLIQEVR